MTRLTRDEIFPFINELALSSGELIQSYFGNAKLAVDSKSDSTPVTEADRNAELLLRELIKKKYPSHGIIGEEFGMENADAEFVWVLDPIDGTKSFIHRVPLFTTLIGLLHQGRPFMGAIHQPTCNMLAIGDMTSCIWNGAPARVRVVKSLAEATVLSSGSEFNRKVWDSAGYRSLESTSRIFRTWGDGFGYLLVATGSADVMIDPGMQLWDLCAVIPVITGAGGRITSVEGGDPLKSLNALATNGHVHEEVLQLLN